MKVRNDWTCWTFFLIVGVLSISTARAMDAGDGVAAPESVPGDDPTCCGDSHIASSGCCSRSGGSCCGACCCDPGCGCCCGGYFSAVLSGVVQPSDTCYCDFISPVTNPVFFEDPRTLTEARAIFLHHRVPTAAGGGDLQLYALQIRAALTDRLSLVAAKDGYVVSDNPLIDDGWADISLGLKYNVLADSLGLLSAGVAYELPWGSHRTLQGNGDGEFLVYLTGGLRLDPCTHWLTTSGFRLPANTSEESQVWYWSNHLDRALGSGFYAFLEANWYHWLRSGENGINGVEGLDLFNFGSTGVASNDIVTGAVGVKYKPHCWLELGVAWEAPLTDRRDVMENRLTVDCILRY